MSLTTDEAARLATLKSVLDKLAMGQLPERVSYNGFDTQFTKANQPWIEGEIAKLESKAAGKSCRARGALGFRF